MSVEIDEVREVFAKHLFENAKKRKSLDTAFMRTIRFVYEKVWEEARQEGYQQAMKEMKDDR